MDEMWSRLKPNILILMFMDLIIAMSCGAILVWGIDVTENIEVALLLASVIGGAAVGFVGLASQVATNDPPNHVQAVINYGIQTMRMVLQSRNGSCETINFTEVYHCRNDCSGDYDDSCDGPEDNCDGPEDDNETDERALHDCAEHDCSGHPELNA